MFLTKMQKKPFVAICFGFSEKIASLTGLYCGYKLNVTCRFCIRVSRCNIYTTVCSSVRGDNPRVLASGLSAVQAERPWYNYFIPPSSV